MWVVPETGEIAFNIGFSGLQNHIEEAQNESRLFIFMHVSIIQDQRLVLMVPIAWLDRPSLIWLMLQSLLLGMAC